MVSRHSSTESQTSNVQELDRFATNFGPHLKSHFPLEDGYTNLNHGSYGSTPHVVTKAAHQWQAQMEACPDKWFRQTVYTELDTARTELATYVGADPMDLVFVENASHGMNAVLRSLVTSSTKILYLSLSYQMVKNTAAYLRDTFGAQLVEVSITFPTSEDLIVKAVEDALEAEPAIGVASIDHITSCPAVLLPVRRIADACRRRGVPLLVDGAHALGHIPLDVPALGADFYVANAHKWLYSPKSAAILWVRRDRQDLVSPTTISNLGRGATPFQLRFSYQGTADVSAYLATRAALAFRRSLGEDAAVAYTLGLARAAAALLVDGWGTDTLVGDELACGMVNVRLPPCADAALLEALPNTLLERYRTWVPVFQLQGQWYVRVSAQIYLGLPDFALLRDAVLDLLSAPSCHPTPSPSHHPTPSAPS